MPSIALRINSTYNMRLEITRLPPDSIVVASCIPWSR